MKRLVLLLALVLSACRVYSYHNTYAVIIGVADYEEFSRNDGDLLYTVNDAKKFCEFLKSRQGGMVPEENIVLLLNEQATKSNIIKQSKQLFARANANDRVIFYYSGHGWKECFMPYDVTKRGRNLLYFDEVKDIFRCARCNTKLLFADACFAGTMKESIIRKSTKRSNRKNKDKDNINIAVMMSCKADETSLELGSLKQGVFTYYLMEGLGGEANKDGNNYITIQELFYYMYQKVQDKAAKKDSKQTPELFGNFDLRLIVANVGQPEETQDEVMTPERRYNIKLIIIIAAAYLIVTVAVVLLIKKINKTQNK